MSPPAAHSRVSRAHGPLAPMRRVGHALKRWGPFCLALAVLGHAGGGMTYIVVLQGRDWYRLHERTKRTILVPCLAAFLAMTWWLIFMASYSLCVASFCSPGYTTDWAQGGAGRQEEHAASCNPGDTVDGCSDADRQTLLWSSTLDDPSRARPLSSAVPGAAPSNDSTLIPPTTSPIPSPPQSPDTCDPEPEPDERAPLLPAPACVGAGADAGGAAASKPANVRRPPPVLAAGLSIKSRGGTRWCRKCKLPKPDRAHHCSVCQRCVLRMDHHCPWLASNCVGYRTYKPFLLFLFYASFACLVVLATGLGSLVLQWGKGGGGDAGGQWIRKRPPLLLLLVVADGSLGRPIPKGPDGLWILALSLVVVSLVFGTPLVPFTCFHIYLVLHNKTTIENLEGRNRLAPLHQQQQQQQQQLLQQHHHHHNHHHHDDDVESAEQCAWHRDSGSCGRTTATSGAGDPTPVLDRATRHGLSQELEQINVYDVGMRRNWCSVMGDDWTRWWKPHPLTAGDGVSFWVDPGKLAQARALETLLAQPRAKPRLPGTEHGLGAHAQAGEALRHVLQHRTRGRG